MSAKLCEKCQRPIRRPQMIEGCFEICPECASNDGHPVDPLELLQQIAYAEGWCAALGHNDGRN